MKKILVAIDYNPSAEKVAEVAYSMAKALGAELTIAHVLTEAAYYAKEYSPIMGYTGGYTSGTVELVEEIKKEAELYLAASVNHLGDSNIKTKVLEGETADAIIKCSNEMNADLIVLGSHSHHGFDRIFGTDTAHYILKHSKLAVLAIPTDDK